MKAFSFVVFFCVALGRVSLRKFRQHTFVSSLSKKATQVLATSLLPNSKKLCVSWKRNFLLLLVVFERGCVEQSVACLCLVYFLRNQPVGFVKGFLLMFQNGWEKKPVRYIYDCRKNVPWIICPFFPTLFYGVKGGLGGESFRQAS